MSFEYLETLNPEQTEAVTHSGSPLLILAGAGSGKTRVITTKIAYLIQHENVQPWSILAVTFTKKAANEMKERAVDLEPLAEQSQIKTFHSFGAWFLRRYAEEAKLDPNFTVYDDDDSASLIMQSVPEITKKKDALIAAHMISLCKDYCLTPDDDLSDFDEDGNLVEIYKAYQNALETTGNADFGDLIMRPVQILKQYEQIRKQMQHRFRVIMVDEYQDSNVAQFQLLQALSGVEEGSGTYVCVVGDDDQSIYKFRGAEVKNILQFPNQFPGTKLIRLERNYRSTGKILAAADAVVSNNTDRLGKTLVADRGEGKQPVLVFLENQDKEAAFCAQLIQKAVETGGHYSDFAVLYRTNAQSLGFETEFLHQQIPYAVVGSLKFWEREEIKDALAYLKVLANPKDKVNFQRIINKPRRHVGPKVQQEILQSSSNKKDELFSKDDLIEISEGLIETIKRNDCKAGLKDFCGLMKDLRKYLDEKSEEAPVDPQTDILVENVIANGQKGSEAISTGSAKENYERLAAFIQKVIEDSGLDKFHKEQDDVDGTNRVQNLQELVNSAVPYPLSNQGLLDFLDAIELDRTLADQSEESPDAVTLITLHNTKGLEFNRVIITGLEGGIFPREDKTGDELEEERRLFYVGITRARNELYITSCGMRRLYGHTQPMAPSRFLVEAGDVFNVMGRVPLSFSRAGGSDSFQQEELSPKAEILEKWKKGVRLFHEDYGYGQIVSSTAASGEVVIEVQFENGERKKFMPEYQGRKLDIIKD